MQVRPIVTSHMPFLNSEAAVQKCYIKVGVLKTLESFQEKTCGEVQYL